jgi:hypothetical protein
MPRGLLEAAERRYRIARRREPRVCGIDKKTTQPWRGDTNSPGLTPTGFMIPPALAAPKVDSLTDHGFVSRYGFFSWKSLSLARYSSFCFGSDSSSIALACHFTAEAKSPASAWAAARVSR